VEYALALAVEAAEALHVLSDLGGGSVSLKANSARITVSR
jgi:hypothetical protein